MGGMGKTELLRRLAHRHDVLTRFPFTYPAPGEARVTVLGATICFRVRPDVRDAWALLSQIKSALRMRLSDDESALSARCEAVCRRLKDFGEDRLLLLLLLDNVWPSSLGVVQQLVDALPDGSNVVVTTRDRGVLVQLQAQAVVLQQVPMPVAVAHLRAHSPGVEVSGATGEALARACGRHPLALAAVGTQLRILCGEQGAAGATPEHVTSLTGAQDSELLQQSAYRRAGWEGFDPTVASCLDWSHGSLGSERLGARAPHPPRLRGASDPAGCTAARARPHRPQHHASSSGGSGELLDRSRLREG